MDFTYLEPPTDAYSVVHQPNEIKVIYSSTKVSRRIFHKVPYDDNETSKIIELKETLQKQNIILNDTWDDAKLLKFVYYGGFHIPKSVEGIKKHLNWQQQHMLSVIPPNVESLLIDGVAYQYGRDIKYRPIIHFNVPQLTKYVNEVDTLMDAIAYLLGIVEQHMLTHYYVESWVIVINCNSMGIFNLPIKALKQIIEMTSTNFCGLMWQTFIVNPPYSILAAWNMITKFIEQGTSNKIKFVSAKTMDQMYQTIPKTQLEAKFGGILPNLISFWPPKSTFQSDNDFESKYQTIQEGDSMRYYSFAKEQNNDPNSLTVLEGEPTNQACCQELCNIM